MGKNIFAFLYCLALSLILTVCVSCGGGGGGGATLHDSTSNPLHHDGSTGGWGAGTSSNNNGGAGGSNGSSGSASEGKLFSLFPYFNPSISTIDISLSINGASPVVLTGLDSSTPKSVLPEMNIGDMVSGTAVIHLSDGSTRNAVCPQREITIDNYLAFITDFRCTLKNTLTDTTLVQNLVFTTAAGIDMSPYASALVSPVALYAWKDTRTGAMYPASGIVYPRAGDAILETVWAAAVPVITYYEKDGETVKTVAGSSETCRYSYLNYGDSVTVSGGGGMPLTIKSSNGSAISGTVTPVGGVSGTPEPFNETCGEYIRYLDPGTYEIFAQVAGGDSSTTTLDVGIRPVEFRLADTFTFVSEVDDSGSDASFKGWIYFSFNGGTETNVLHWSGKNVGEHSTSTHNFSSTIYTISSMTDISDSVKFRLTDWIEDDTSGDDEFYDKNFTYNLSDLRNITNRQLDMRTDHNNSDDYIIFEANYTLSD